MKGQRDGSVLLFGAILCWFVGLLILAVASLYVWILRDGLGPDSEVESHGLLALSRFWRDIRSILTLYVIPLFLLGCLLYRWDARRDARRRPDSAPGNTQTDSASVTPEV
jgi:hypothetical protein